MAVDHSATPDQLRAAQKRATAAAEAEAAAKASRDGDKAAPEVEARTAPPKGRRVPKGDEG